MRGWMAPHGDMAYGIFSGPGEAIILILFVLGVRACLGLGFIYKHYVHGMKFFIIPYVVQNFVHTDVWDEGNPDSIGQVIDESSKYLYVYTYFFMYVYIYVCVCILYVNVYIYICGNIW